MDHNNNLFADNQQFNSYDNLNLFQNGSDSNFNEAGWGVNASDFGSQSRAQVPAGWQQNTNHNLSVPSSHAGYNGQASPYGRTVNQSPVSFNQNQYQNFNQQQQQSFQPYGQSQYDQSLFPRPGNGQNFNTTITPQALERDAQAGYTGSPYANPAFANNAFGQNPTPRPGSTTIQARPVNQKLLSDGAPKGIPTGMFSIINFDTLARATNTERMGNYVNIGKEPLELGLTRSAIPMYAPRKSRSELRALASNNPAALARIGKKSSKKTKNYPSLLSDIKSASVSASTGVKHEQDSSSSEDSSSDDDSEYTDDDDDEDSPLPAKRPENPKAGVEYDTIKALWRSKRKTLSSESIRKGLVDFWDLVKNIRDRWKKDAQDVADAEEKKQTGQLPLLQSRVKDQRDMIESAFKAALKHGHRGLLELLSENVALMFLCYQFLLDRFKADDINGGLTRAILETMSLSTTLTHDKIDKTHLDKVLPRYSKRGDAKTQFYTKKILANADIADKEAAAKPEKKTEKTTAKQGDEKSTSSLAKRPAPEPVAGVKRAAATSTGDGTAQKKAATTTTKTNGVTAVPKVNGAVKKPASSSDPTKSTTSSSTAPATRKTVVPKSSGFFSNLQSAAKKPGTSNADKAATSASKPANKTTSAPKPAFSFAETMANLAKPKEEKPAAKPQKEVPSETPEEREKRLRKERRRKMHVTFKTGEDLVQIRYFTHDPQEEIGHDSSQMRDMADVGGEGRVLKQHAHMMDIDDEDDVIEEDQNLIDFTAPSLVDFSVVDREERNRNYSPYGGGVHEPESKERAIRNEYENNNLIVIYTDPSQIPPDPREPADPYTGESGPTLRYFGAPDEEKYSLRAQAKKNQQYNRTLGGFDMTAFLKKQQHPQTYPQPQPQPQAAPSMPPDLMGILASIQKSAPAQATPPPPQASPAYHQPYMGMQQPVVPPPPPAAPNPGQLDLGAILASLNANNNQQQGTYGAPNSAPMGFGQQPQMGNTGSNDDVAKIKARNPNYKTKICRFWQDGRCQKGDSCSYLHEAS